MDKCRLACNISEEDAHITAFPEDNKVDEDGDQEVDEDSEGPCQLPNQANADAAHDVTDTSHVRDNSSNSSISNKMLQAQQAVAGRQTEQRYNLRKR